MVLSSTVTLSLETELKHHRYPMISIGLKAQGTEALSSSRCSNFSLQVTFKRFLLHVTNCYDTLYIFTRPTQYLLALHIRGLEFKEANFRNFRGSVYTIALDVGNVGQCTLPKDRTQ